MCGGKQWVVVLSFSILEDTFGWNDRPDHPSPREYNLVNFSFIPISMLYLGQAGLLQT